MNTNTRTDDSLSLDIIKGLITPEPLTNAAELLRELVDAELEGRGSFSSMYEPECAADVDEAIERLLEHANADTTGGPFGSVVACRDGTVEYVYSDEGLWLSLHDVVSSAEPGGDALWDWFVRETYETYDD